MIKHILFDLDGTLADTALDLAYALNVVREWKELPEIPIDLIRPTVSLGANVMIKLGFNLEVDQLGFDEIKKKFLDVYAKNIARETKLFDGMADVLNRLEDEKKIWGIVTNKSTSLTMPLLKELSLDDRASCTVCGDTVEHNKPHPAPVIHACKLIEANPASTVFVGDAKRDVESGSRAGTKTLIALYGYIENTADPKSWGADGMVSTPHDLHEKLREIGK